MKAKQILIKCFYFIYHLAIPSLYLIYFLYLWKESSSCYKRMYIPLFFTFFIGFHRCIAFLNYFSIKKQSFDLEVTIIFWIIFGINLFNDGFCENANEFLEYLTLYLFYFVLFGNTITYSLFFLMVLILSVNTVLNVIDSFENEEEHEIIEEINGFNDEEFKKLKKVTFLKKINKKIIFNNKDKKIGKKISEGLVCSICLINFIENDILINTNECNHLFHIDCLRSWLKEHVNCPYCRKNLKENLNVIDNDKSNDFVYEKSNNFNSLGDSSKNDKFNDEENQNGIKYLSSDRILKDIGDENEIEIRRI